MADLQVLKALLPDNPLCGISTYKDTLNLATGAYTRQIKEVVLKGDETETWSMSDSLFGKRFSMTLTGAKQSDTSTVATICSHLPLGVAGATYSETNTYTITAASVLYISRDGTYTSVADFKAWLATEYANGTPVTLWYAFVPTETGTIPVPSGLSGTEEGYLTQSGTPSPSAPIYPTANTVNVWQHSLRKLTTATEAVENPLYTDGTPITSYTIKGNTVQDGTPTPSNPITISGVGNKTANLFDVTAWAASVTSVRGNGSFSVSGNTISVTSNEQQDAYTIPYTNVTGVYKILVEPNTQYRIQGTISSSGSIVIFQNGTTASWSSVGAVTTAADTTFLTIRFGVKSTEPLGSTATFENFMISEGASLKEYEPYGYKIPISTLQGSAVNYLGSVQSKRQIEKLVLDGTETLSYQVQPPLFIINIPTNHFIPRVTALCTEYNYNSAQSSILANSQHGDFGLQYVNVRDEYNVWFNNSTFSTNDEFKAYLAQQYANGTPVTVWYVLQTATTGIVNEPLMKIGTYADSISNAVAIPTTEGANSITVDTTVQPSEFTATWTGWHNAYVKEKSENLFDEGTIQVGGLDYQTGEEVPNENRRRSGFIAVNSDTYYSISRQLAQTSPSNFWVLGYDENKNPITDGIFSSSPCTIVAMGGDVGSASFWCTQTTKYIRWYVTANNSYSNLMLNTGQTALPYEPYWK